MSTEHWSARAGAELPVVTLPAQGAGGLAVRPDVARLARDVRQGWTGRCLALTAAYVAIVYLIAATVALPLHWPVAHMLRQAQAVLLLAYVPLLVAFFAGGAVGPRARLVELRSHLFSVRFLGELLLAMLAVHVTLMAFVNLKQYVPAINERLWDSPLWRLDEVLHFGVAPSVAASNFAAEHGLLPWLDRAYLVFFPVQVVVPLLFLLAPSLRQERGRLFFAYCLLWMVGSAVYVLWPSLGPCYYRASRFGWLDQAPYARHLQDVLIRDYARFRHDPSYYQVKLYYGVAALPSLHVAVVALFAMASRRWRSLCVALWALTLVTFVGSLALAWHYAVDGYLGAALAWGCWWVAGRAVGAIDEREPEPAGAITMASGLARPGAGGES